MNWVFKDLKLDEIMMKEQWNEQILFESASWQLGKLPTADEDHAG